LSVAVAVSVMLPAVVTLVELLASETVGLVVSPPLPLPLPLPLPPPVPIGMVVPLSFTLTMVALENALVPVKPTSQVWPIWIGWNCSQSGFVAERPPEASAAATLPFHPVPETPAVPASWNTIWNEAIGLANPVSMIRTAPLKPPFQLWVGSTSMVTPLPETATAPTLSADRSYEPPLHAARASVSPRRGKDNRRALSLVMRRSPFRHSQAMHSA